MADITNSKGEIVAKIDESTGVIIPVANDALQQVFDTFKVVDSELKRHQVLNDILLDEIVRLKSK